MKYLSLCSGIEAATVAWHPLGWEAVAYSEIERFPSEVLAHHYPSTPNLGDMTKFKEWNLGTNVDLLVGGTPCQSFSVAGLRKGLDDPRGNLMLTYLAIADKYRPRWLVWENVPGVLSSNGGKDFGVFLGALGELGYGFAYRVLDAQYFGVAQRRRRVFVVGYLGDWRAAAAVLFERHSLSGHPAPSRETRQSVAASVRSSTQSGFDCGVELTGPLQARDYKDAGTDGMSKNSAKMIPVTKAFYESSLAQYKEADLAGTAKASGGVAGGGSETFIAQPMAYNIAPGKGALKDDIHVTDAYATKTLDASGSNPAMHQGGAAILQAICLMDQGGSVMNIENDMTGTLRRETHGHEPIVMQPTIVHGTQDPCVSDIAFAQGRNNGGENVMVQHMAVRRLTPVECERLQGFPDNYTDIKSKGKPTPDGPRYKALGNSMAVPVMAWIGQRIQEVEAICKQNK